MPSFRNFRNISYYRASGLQEYVDSETAHRLLADGSHEWRCVSCGKAKGEGACTGTNHVMALFEMQAEEFDDAKLKPRAESDTSLTFGDMKRNVGITEGWPGMPAEMRLVHRARHRIRCWGSASLRNRAVTVIPRGSLAGKPRANVIVPR